MHTYINNTYIYIYKYIHRLHTLNAAFVLSEKDKVSYSETSVRFWSITRLHIPGDGSLHVILLFASSCFSSLLRSIVFNSMTSKICFKVRIRTFPNSRIPNSHHFSYFSNLKSDVKFYKLSYFRNKSWILLLLLYMLVPKP